MPIRFNHVANTWEYCVMDRFPFGGKTWVAITPSQARRKIDGNVNTRVQVYMTVA